MAWRKVRQVKAQHIVVNKGPMYECGGVYLYSVVVGEQRTYVVRTLEGTKKDPNWDRPSTSRRQKQLRKPSS